MSDLAGCFSHKSDNWKTPKKIYNFFMKRGFTDCFKYMSEEDEFKKSYRGGRLFVNPPYSKMGEVINWVIKQANQDNEIWLLIPVRTDTKYFRKLIYTLGYKICIFFITGRLKFNDSKNSAPFPSMFVVISDKARGAPQSFTVFDEDELIHELKEYY